MITYVEGDLFQSPAKVLVNTVNTVGVMGKGIANEFKQIYPDMFKRYRALCEKKQLKIGQLWLYKTSNKWILNFPTKMSWREKSRPEYIEEGLKKFVTTYDAKEITSISFPMLGCGNGELDWETQVRPLMEKYLKKLPITIYIHLYKQTGLIPEHRDVQAVHQWLHQQPQGLAFGEFWADLETLLSTKRQFKTLDTGTEFDVSIGADREGIQISPKTGIPIFIAKEEDGLLDLWQHIRAAGYCMPDKLPVGLDLHAAYVIGLLSELDYMSPIRLSLPDDRQEQIGLQLKPKQVAEVPEPNVEPNIVTLVA